MNNISTLQPNENQYLHKPKCAFMEADASHLRPRATPTTLTCQHCVSNTIHPRQLAHCPIQLSHIAAAMCFRVRNQTSQKTVIPGDHCSIAQYRTVSETTGLVQWKRLHVSTKQSTHSSVVFDIPLWETDWRDQELPKSSHTTCQQTQPPCHKWLSDQMPIKWGNTYAHPSEYGPPQSTESLQHPNHQCEEAVRYE